MAVDVKFIMWWVKDSPSGSNLGGWPGGGRSPVRRGSGGEVLWLTPGHRATKTVV